VREHPGRPCNTLLLPQPSEKASLLWAYREGPTRAAGGPSLARYLAVSNHRPEQQQRCILSIPAMNVA
jgi:hypothetical protein